MYFELIINDTLFKVWHYHNRHQLQKRQKQPKTARCGKHVGQLTT